MSDKLNKFLNAHITANGNTSIIDVLPLCCGVGKSTYIKHRLSQALSTGEHLIVVTDRINRLDDYLNNDDLQSYIQRNKQRITALNADNASTELKTLHCKDIVLLTTQRYFNSR